MKSIETLGEEPALPGNLPLDHPARVQILALGGLLKGQQIAL